MVIAVMATVAVVYVLVRRPMLRALYPRTGLDEWRRTARRLPCADRWTIYRAVSKGLAVEPRLAPLAVQRARTSLAMLAMMQRRRMLWWFIGIQSLGIALIAAAAVLVGQDPRVHNAWIIWLLDGVLVVLLGAFVALMSWQIPRTRRRFQRCIDLNRQSPGNLPDLRSLP